MTASARSGKHRSNGRYNPVSEISIMVTRAGEAGVKASAVLAASGGLVAAFALPASASPSARAASAAPATHTSAAPALVAPEASAPVKVEAFGVVGVRAVAKPVVAAVPVDLTGRSSSTASRSSTRSSGTTPAPKRVLPPASSGVVAIARSLLGIPYVYGGSSPSGFDCSGFTQYVYARAGKSIPRTAAAQQAAAVRVSNPQPGDLVFFGAPAYHVGIYVGGGQMIDSPHTGTVTQQRAIYSSNVTYGRF